MDVHGQWGASPPRRRIIRNYVPRRYPSNHFRAFYRMTRSVYTFCGFQKLNSIGFCVVCAFCGNYKQRNYKYNRGCRINIIRSLMNHKLHVHYTNIRTPTSPTNSSLYHSKYRMNHICCCHIILFYLESSYTNTISNNTYTHHQLVLQPIQLEHQMSQPH